MKIMVTGANGGYGHYAIQYLKEFAPAGTELYGLVRDDKKAQQLMKQEITPRIGDYSNVASLVDAFKGIDRLLFISVPYPNLQRNVVEAIKNSRINFVAYTSLYGLNYEKFGLEQNHRATEKLIKQLGIKHVFLRNNFYLEITAPQLKSAIETGQFEYLSGDGKVAWALKREYAEAGARVILSDQYGEVVNLAGKPVTYPKLAQATSIATGKKIEIKAVTPEQLSTSISSMELSQMEVHVTLSYQDYAKRGNNGEAHADPVEFEQVLGHPLTSLPEAVKEVINNNKVL